jgi:hypothetical protein
MQLELSPDQAAEWCAVLMRWLYGVEMRRVTEGCQ